MLSRIDWKLSLGTFLAIVHLIPAYCEPVPIAAVILSRHGARTPLFKDTKTFAEGNSELTIEGKNQLYERGQFLHDRWTLDAGSAMVGFADTYYQNQTYVRSSDTDRTINSAQSLLMALYPPKPAQTLRLANGTTLAAPGSSDQQVPIHVVGQNEDIALRGWFNCTKLDKHVSDLFASDAFKSTQAQHQTLLDALSPRFGRPLGLVDMWNVFDYLNTQRSYNASFQDLTADQWTELTSLVNYLEYEKFKPGYAAANFLAEVIKELKASASSGATRKVTYFSGHYTTFVNFFGLTGLSTAVENLRAIPDYGSLLIFELLADAGKPERYVRVSFRNGQSEVQVLSVPGLSAMALLPDFVTRMQPLSAEGLDGWCAVCGNNENRGCDLRTAAFSTTGSGQSSSVKPIVAGFGGAAVGLTAAIIGAVIVHKYTRRKWVATEVLDVDRASQVSSTKQLLA
ncbi:hypothetical protein SpCBS45565_g07871 [Spizellomyces sp. 'palustris']|nr:hypothetical protein SpCBS45565_g07871 [Spizellomyces sp. 'palustris']